MAESSTIERVKINPIDAQAISVRLQRDGVVTTYVLPPQTDKMTAAPATLTQALHYCQSELEVAEHRARAAPESRLYAHEAAIFAGLVRLIEACLGNDTIKQELRYAARDRANAAREAIAAEAAPELDAEPPA